MWSTALLRISDTDSGATAKSVSCNHHPTLTYMREREGGGGGGRERENERERA